MLSKLPVISSLIFLLALPACQEKSASPALPLTVSERQLLTPRAKFNNPFVQIYGYDENDVRVSTCSGTWVAPPADAPADAKGRVLTCLHCILSTKRLQVLAADQELYDVNLLTCWVANGDLVILSVSGIQARQTPQVQIAQAPLRKGMPVLLRHAPRGIYRESQSSVTAVGRYEGYVVGVSGSVYVNSSTFTVSLAIDPGSSGGGVFNQSGELVGVLNMGSVRESRGIPSSRLRDLERFRPPVNPADFAMQYSAWLRSQQFGVPNLVSPY